MGFRLSDTVASVPPRPTSSPYPGPEQVYLSRVPEGMYIEAHEAVGDGGLWFKIDTAGPQDDRNWKLLSKREVCTSAKL